MRRRLILAVVIVVAVLSVLWIVSQSETAVAPPADGTAAVPDAAPHDAARRVRAKVEAPPECAPEPAGPADRDLDLSGIVTDTSGAPVAGAEVLTSHAVWPAIRFSPLDNERHAERTTGPSSRTAADGSFRLRLERGQAIDLTVRAGGFVEEVLRDRVAGEVVRITLRHEEECATLVVVARDGAGAPVADATIRLWQGRDGDHREIDGGRTDAVGRRRIAGLQLGPAWVQVVHDRYAHASFTVLLRDPGETVRDVTLVAGRTLRGRVTDARSKAAIAGAQVAAWGRRKAVLTDADGRYEWCGYVDTQFGDWNIGPLVASAAGYRLNSRLVPLDTDEIDFALAPGANVTGRIVDSAGGPLTGALVESVACAFDATANSNDLEHRVARTGDDGRFVLADVRPGVAHTLVARFPGRGRTLRDFELASEATGCDLGDIPLAEGRRVEGRVIDGNGAAVTGVVVEIRGANADRTPVPLTLPGLPVSGLVARETARTDDLGRFRFRDLAPGAYRLCAPFLAARQVTQVIEVGDAPGVLGLEVALPAGPFLTVRVLDPDGVAVPGIDVYLDWAPGWRVMRRSGGDGRVTFTGLPDHDVEVTVEPPRGLGDAGWVGRSWVIRPSGQQVDIPLRRVGWIRGTVVAPDGSPLPLEVLRVRARGEGAAAEGAFCDVAGRFEIRLAAGVPVEIRVAGARRNPRTLTWSSSPWRGVAENVAAPAEIVLRAEPMESDRSLQVTVVDPDGGAIADATVRADVKPSRPEERTDARGRAAFGGLDWDYVWLTVTVPEARRDRDDVPPVQYFVVLPETTETVLVLRRAAWIEGRVLAPDGTAAAGATVTASTMSAPPQTVQSDREGRFRVTSFDDAAADIGAAWVGRNGEPCSSFKRGVLAGRTLEIRLTPTPPHAN